MLFFAQIVTEFCDSKRSVTLNVVILNGFDCMFFCVAIIQEGIFLYSLEWWHCLKGSEIARHVSNHINITRKYNVCHFAFLHDHTSWMDRLYWCCFRCHSICCRHWCFIKHHGCIVVDLQSVSINVPEAFSLPRCGVQSSGLLLLLLRCMRYICLIISHLLSLVSILCCYSSVAAAEY